MKPKSPLLERYILEKYYRAIIWIFNNKGLVKLANHHFQVSNYIKRAYGILGKVSKSGNLCINIFRMNFYCKLNLKKWSGDIIEENIAYVAGYNDESS